MMASRLDEAYLIDMSDEDDSLLPAADKATPTSLDDPQPSSSVASSPIEVPGHMGYTTEATIQKDPPSCQPECVSIPEEPANLAIPMLTEEPALAKKKKKKNGFNVRKSLAWNNAFLTDEGMLDTEELSLVNRTFQKPLGLPKPSILKKPSPTSKLVKPPMMPKISLTSHTMALTAESQQNLVLPAVSSPRSSTGSVNGSVSKMSEQHFNHMKGLNGTRHGATTPISLANVQMDTAKMVGLGKAMVPAHADSSDSKLLLRRSFDKKDQGLSLPGVSHYKKDNHLSVVDVGSDVWATTASGSVTSKGVAHSKHVMKEGRLISQSANSESSRHSSLMKSTGERSSSIPAPRAQPVPSSTRLLSETTSTKTHPTTKKSPQSEGSGTVANRDKPSGLRMPSPKLGFFDTGKTTSQVAVLRERTNGHGYGGPGLGRSSMAGKSDADINSSRSTTNQIHGLRYPAASAKSGNQLLEASRNQTRGIKSSTNIPGAPRVPGRSAEVAPMRAASAHESPKSTSYLSNRKVDSREQVLQAKKIGQNTSTWGKPPIRSQPATSAARNVLGQENLSPDCKDGKGMLEKGMVAQGLVLGSPNIKSSDETCPFEVNMCEEHAQHALSPAQNSVSH
eukprot:c22378_g1_i1 orf=350-2212(+)